MVIKGHVFAWRKSISPGKKYHFGTAGGFCRCGATVLSMLYVARYFPTDQACRRCVRGMKADLRAIKKALGPEGKKE